MQQVSQSGSIFAGTPLNTQSLTFKNFLKGLTHVFGIFENNRSVGGRRKFGKTLRAAVEGSGSERSCSDSDCGRCQSMFVSRLPDRACFNRRFNSMKAKLYIVLDRFVKRHSLERASDRRRTEKSEQGNESKQRRAEQRVTRAESCCTPAHSDSQW